MSDAKRARRDVQRILVRFVQRKGVVGGLDGLIRLVSAQPHLATAIAQWVESHRLEFARLGLADRGLTRDTILDYCRARAGSDHTRIFVRPAGLEPERQPVSATPTAPLSSVESISGLVEKLKADDPAVRKAATAGLAAHGTAAVDELVAVLGSDDPRARIEALRTLRRLGAAAAAAAPQVVALLSDEESHVRRSAASTLGELGPGAAASVPELKELLESDDRQLRRVAADALRRMQQEEQIDIPVEDLGCDPQWLVSAPYDEIAATAERIVRVNLHQPDVAHIDGEPTVIVPSPVWEPGAGGKVGRRRCRLHQSFAKHYYVGDVAEQLRRPESLALVAKTIHHHRGTPHVLLRMVAEVEELWVSEEAALDTIEDPYRPLDKLTSLLLASFGRATRAGLSLDDLSTMAALPGAGGDRDAAIRKLQALYRRESKWHAQALDTLQDNG